MEIKLPANWTEIIDSGKYLQVIKILQTPAPDVEHVKSALFIALTGYNVSTELNGVPLENTSISELMLAATLIDEVFPMLEFITGRVAFYKNPLRVIEHEGKKYIGPDDRLVNQTGEEWSLSHHAEHLYTVTRDKQHIIALLAANWHLGISINPDNPDALIRTQYSESSHEKAMEAFVSLPDEVLFGAFLWYQHADEWWSKKFPELFGANEEGPAIKPSGFEVRNIIFELAGNKLDDAWDKLQTRRREDIIYALQRLEARRD